MTERTYLHGPQVPWYLRILGVTYLEVPVKSFRCSWLEWSKAKWGLALQYTAGHDKEEDPHPRLNIDLPLLGHFYFKLPWTHYYQPNGYDTKSWGFSTSHTNSLHLYWGRKCKIFNYPWSYECIDQSIFTTDNGWVENQPLMWHYSKSTPDIWKEPYPVTYVLDDGTVQETTATIKKHRMISRRRFLKWTKLFQKTVYYIHADFAESIGEGVGSWKGGTCGSRIDTLPDETPYMALKRMMETQRFGR